MTTHDRNPACKHDFIDLEHLSKFHNHILIIPDLFGIPPLMLILLLFLE